VASEPNQKHPSTAHYRGEEYIPCKDNQPLAIAEAEGRTGAQPIAEHKHPTSISGYCEHGKLGGCEKD